MLYAHTGHTVAVNTTVHLDGTSSSDPDSDPIAHAWQFSLKPANSTAVLAEATTATPSFVSDVPGLYGVQLTVTDPHGARGTDVVNVTAEVTNHPPTITSTAVTTATVGQPYSYHVEATDLDAGDVLPFSLTKKPDGMTINSSTGLIQWTPMAAQVGDNSVAVRATDKGGLFAEQNFVVAVAAAPVNHLPVAVDDTYEAISGGSLAVPTPGVLSNDTDSDGDALTASVVQGPIKGTVDLHADGSFLYTPLPPTPATTFNPVLEWSWTSSAVLPASLNVGNTPAIIDMNSDGIPDVVFGSTSSTGGRSRRAAGSARRYRY